MNAIEKAPNADTLIITRVVTEPKGDDTTCAYVYGRGIRLKKAGAADQEDTAEPETTPVEETDERK